jgi:hypothetical protein
MINHFNDKKEFSQLPGFLVNGRVGGCVGDVVVVTNLLVSSHTF